jgi:hypothetical protein
MLKRLSFAMNGGIPYIRSKGSNAKVISSEIGLECSLAANGHN